MNRSRLAVMTAILSATFMVAGAQNASAQWCCSVPTVQYAPSCNYNYGNLTVQQGTYYQPLDPNFVTPDCGWTTYTGPAMVMVGRHRGDCTVDATETGRVVNLVNQPLFFFKKKWTVRNYCPPVVRRNPCPPQIVPRDDCPGEGLAEELQNAPKASAEEKKLLADI